MGWGDELMACGEAMAVGGKVKIMDKSGNVRKHAAWDNNPHIVQSSNEAADHHILNSPGARPYVKTVGATAWEFKPYKPKPAKFYFTDEEQAYIDRLPADFVVIEPGLKEKMESQNRRWDGDNFAMVTQYVNAKWIQLGSVMPQLLPNAEWICTPTPRHMAAVLSKAKAFVSHEGGLHHTAAAFGLQGVVIYGGFVSPQVTGYDMHHNLFVGDGLGCGKRVKCPHCTDAMNRITPQMVIDPLRKILNG